MRQREEKMSKALLAMLFILTNILSSSAIAGGDDAGSASSIERGRRVFAEHCILCHGLKYYRDKEHPSGMSALIDSKSATASFGAPPPDLSLIASARGKGQNGARYLEDLLTGYYVDPTGKTKNRAFAAFSGNDGTIAMPPPISTDDPSLSKKARDVSAFLLETSDPSARIRACLGRYVLAYMALMTVLLFVLNRSVWKGLKKNP